MKRYFILIFLVCISAVLVFAQTSKQTVVVDGQKYFLHEVQAGETIFTICKLYQIEQKELVQANPQLIYGLKQGDSLKIKSEKETVNTPVQKVDEGIHNVNNTSSDKFIYHVVKKSETIYSISRQYNIPIKSIYAFNPEAEGEVLENEIIRIPQEAKDHFVDGLIREDGEFYYHKVQPKENAYALARKYNTSVSGIFKFNPKVEENFEIGMIVRIPKFEQKREEVSVEESGEFFIYLVQSGDTYYAFQRRFGVSQDELKRLNPVLNDGLKTGLRIKVPSTKIQKVEVVSVPEAHYNKHIVDKGQTLYSLSKLYNVAILDIKNWNPELKVRGLIAGETILIGKAREVVAQKVEKKVEEEPKEESKVVEPIFEEQKSVVEKVESILPELVFTVEKQEYHPECQHEFAYVESDTFRISMFLPLFYDKNDTFNLEIRDEEELAYLDSMKSISPYVFSKYFDVEYDSITMLADTILIDSMKVKPERSLLTFPNNPTLVKNMVSFYEGLLLAVDSMERAGVHVRVDLYDSQNKKYVVDSILYTNDFINTDLIIGPVYAHLQEEISNFSAKNQIPLVSPFQSSERYLKNNANYFQVIPSKDYVLRKTADFISDQYYDKNFVIMTLGSYTQLKEGDLVDMIREKFFSTGVYEEIDEIRFTEVDFAKEGTRGYWQVKKTLKPNVENVIFIPTTDNRREREALLSRAINALNVLSAEFDITLIGVSDYPLFQSINTEYFHHLNLHYLAPTNIDYSRPDVNWFISQYRTDFGAEPGRYSYMGYDVAYFFMDAYRVMGRNFKECISGFSTDLLQSDFNFQKVDEFSGFMNHSLFIMNYAPSYDVQEVSTITEGRSVLK